MGIFRWVKPIAAKLLSVMNASSLANAVLIKGIAASVFVNAISMKLIGSWNRN